MKSLYAIWVAMRFVSYAVFAFILGFAVNGASLADSMRAIVTFDTHILLASPIAAGICLVLWLVWAFASWRFLFGK